LTLSTLKLHYFKSLSDSGLRRNPRYFSIISRSSLSWISWVIWNTRLTWYPRPHPLSPSPEVRGPGVAVYKEDFMICTNKHPPLSIYKSWQSTRVIYIYFYCCGRAKTTPFLSRRSNNRDQFREFFFFLICLKDHYHSFYFFWILFWLNLLSDVPYWPLTPTLLNNK
jgi:hypothetical protein